METLTREAEKSNENSNCKDRRALLFNGHVELTHTCILHLYLRQPVQIKHHEEFLIRASDPETCPPGMKMGG